MKLRLLTVFTASLLTLASSNIGNTAPKLVQTINCNLDASTPVLQECARRSAQASDRKLNQVYQQLIPKLDREQKQRLIQSQLSWIKFRDTTCVYERGEWHGGTGAAAAESLCLARVTQQRIADLQNYLDRAQL